MPLRAVPATPADIPFMESLLLAGARKGHFSAELVGDRDRLRRELASIVTRQRLLGPALAAEATIYRDGIERCGIAIMSGVTEWPDAIELYAIAVHRKFRDRGDGRTILDGFLGKWLALKDVYVRCLPPSEKLYQMLLRRGFRYLFSMPSGARVVYHRRQGTPERAPGQPGATRPPA